MFVEKDPIPLTSDQLHVWHFSLTDNTALSEARETLSGDEIERSRRFVFDKDRNRFMVARTLLRQLLSSYTSEEPAKIRFSYNPQGKPSIAGDLSFNLSHSGDMAVFACCLHREIGIDLEMVKPVDDPLHMAGLVFTDEETGLLQRLPEEQKNRFFFMIWTRKEALLKAAGAGIGDVLKRLPVMCGNGPMHESATSCFRGKYWRIHDLEIADDCCGAVCYELPGGSDGMTIISRTRLRQLP